MPSLKRDASGKHRHGPPMAVYLDYHASTPCDPRVVEAMLPFFVETIGNPSSSVHAAGRLAAQAVEQSRGALADLIGAESQDIVFTSGATESNNIAIQGACSAAPSHRKKILASAIEHKSILETCRHLEHRGYELQLIPVLEDGQLDVAALVDLVDEDTVLVTVQAANNEIGTIQPMAEVAQIAHRVGAVVHCDAAQAPGRMRLDVGQWDVDLMSLSGHKCYGPKGVGALYVRTTGTAAPIDPITYGGGQERGFRPGSLNVPGIAGFGKAAEIAREELAGDTVRLTQLRDWFESLVLAARPNTAINGSVTHRIPGNSSLFFPRIDAEALIANIPEVAVSAGSACTSGALEPSHVLTAIGMSRDDASCCLRIGLGRFTMPSELEYAAHRICEAADRIGALSKDLVLEAS